MMLVAFLAVLAVIQHHGTVLATVVPPTFQFRQLHQKPQQSAIKNLAEIKLCEDVDELPAWKGDPWAQNFEVVGPYTELCRVPIPQGYTTHYEWPKCLFKVPAANVARAKAWANIKAGQHWVKLRGDTVEVPRAGGSMPAARFLGMLPPALNMTQVRTVLDEGAGVCGLAAEIMLTYTHKPLVLSYAPHDTHANQIQVCGERGVPAIIFSMGRYQFPVPPSSFDMVTCKWCWHWVVSASIGQWLVEVDRVLRPGGHFVFFADVWGYHNFRRQIEYWSGHLGWVRLANKPSAKSDLAVFQKPSEQVLQLLGVAGGGGEQAARLYADPAQAKQLQGIPMPRCQEDDVGQPSFRKLHMPCRITESRAQLAAAAQAVAARDAAYRAEAVPLSGPSDKLDPASTPVGARAYALRILGAMAKDAALLSVLDGNPRGGALGAALRSVAPATPHTWVMHVHPVTTVEFYRRGGTNYAGVSNAVYSVGDDQLLGLMASRGQLGLYHDWCYSFPTYPRTFDLIVFDHVVCRYWCLTQFLLELDRLIRPGGYISLNDAHGRVTNEVVAPLGWEPVVVPTSAQAMRGLPDMADEFPINLWRKSWTPPPLVVAP